MKYAKQNDNPEFTVSPSVDAWLDGCPEVRAAQFLKSVLSFGGDRGGMPEMALYSLEANGGTGKKSRTARMWYTPHGLVCKQTHGSIIVPLSNVAFVKFE